MSDHRTGPRCEPHAPLRAISRVCAVLVAAACSGSSMGSQPSAGEASLREEPVTLAVEQGRIRLSGTLTLPRAQHAVPALCLVPGASPFDRDESFDDYRPFRELAAALAREGIGTLSLDDRGVGDSTGAKLDASLAELAADVAACVRHLAARTEIDSRSVGILGHSQGAMLAPLVAEGDSPVAFAILLAGPGVPAVELMALELGRGGIGEPADNLLVAEALTRAVARNEKADTVDTEALLERIREEWRRTVAGLPEARRPAVVSFTETFEQRLAPFLGSRMLREVLVHDPRPALERLRVPVLVMIGERDGAILRTLPRIAGALEAGGTADYILRKLPGLDHLLQDTEATGLGRAVAPAVAAWVQERFVRRE